jgi:N-acetylmuramoyl-L-alanine amidase CwlA
MKIIKDYITPNEYSRSQEKIVKVKGVVIHWVANPNTSAQANRNFFNNRRSGNSGYGSAHFVVGQVGEIIQCMPLEEVAYHVGSSTYTSEALSRLGDYPNEFTIGIECCHIDWQGNMKDITYDSVVDLTAYLLKEYGLTTKDIWTHQEVVGWKDCHRLFYKNPNLYQKFKDDVARAMFGNVSSQPTNEVTPNTYVIKSGDTLYGIAEKFNLTVDAILAQNPNLNPRSLQIGETIRLSSTSFVTHEMEAGDTLWAISRHYNVSVDEIKRLNPNLDITAIPIGTKVKVKEVASNAPISPTPVTTKPVYDLPTGVFGYNSRGEDVKKIQRALNALNFNVGEVDGIYGNATRNAVYRYQTMYAHLATDGIYGNSTRQQMLKDLAK